MHEDIKREILHAYAADPPAQAQAQDATPADILRRAISRLGRKWLARFDKLGPQLAAYFAKASGDRSDAQLRTALRDAGFTVRFRLTPEWRDALQATISENVSLIKSIATQYHTAIEGAVMRSVATGGDLRTLAAELEKTYGVTRRRAALISRDQNAKATAALTRVRQQEVGVTHARWLHSRGGRTPRPSHVANSGKVYDVRTGWFDPDERVYCWPGTLINCRCVSIPLIPGLDDDDIPA